jgi:hypothetical protein
VDESICAEVKGWVMPKNVPRIKISVNSLCGLKIKASQKEDWFHCGKMYEQQHIYRELGTNFLLQQ